MKFAYSILALFVLFLIGNAAYLRWAKSVERTALSVEFPESITALLIPTEPRVEWRVTRDAGSLDDTYTGTWTSTLGAPTTDAIRDFIWTNDTSSDVAITFTTRVCQGPSLINGKTAVCR